jgi:hypothetical protein
MGALGDGARKRQTPRKAPNSRRDLQTLRNASHHQNHAKNGE